MHLQNRKRLMDLKNKLMVVGGKDWGRDSQGVLDGHVHTAIFKMGNQQRPSIAYGTLLNISGSQDERGVWERMDTYICITESFCFPPEIITRLVVCYTTIKNKKITKSKTEKQCQLLCSPMFCNKGQVEPIQIFFLTCGTQSHRTKFN